MSSSKINPKIKNSVGIGTDQVGGVGIGGGEGSGRGKGVDDFDSPLISRSIVVNCLSWSTFG